MDINIHAKSKKGRNSFFRDLKRPVAEGLEPEKIVRFAGLRLHSPLRYAMGFL